MTDPHQHNWQPVGLTETKHHQQAVGYFVCAGCRRYTWRILTFDPANAESAP